MEAREYYVTGTLPEMVNRAFEIVYRAGALTGNLAIPHEQATELIGLLCDIGLLITGSHPSKNIGEE